MAQLTLGAARGKCECHPSDARDPARQTAWLSGGAQPMAVSTTAALFDTSAYGPDGAPGTDGDACSRANKAKFSLADPSSGEVKAATVKKGKKRKADPGRSVVDPKGTGGIALTATVPVIVDGEERFLGASALLAVDPAPPAQKKPRKGQSDMRGQRCLMRSVSVCLAESTPSIAVRPGPRPALMIAVVDFVVEA